MRIGLPRRGKKRSGRWWTDTLPRSSDDDEVNFTRYTARRSCSHDRLPRRRISFDRRQSRPLFGPELGPGFWSGDSVHKVCQPRHEPIDRYDPYEQRRRDLPGNSEDQFVGNSGGFKLPWTRLQRRSKVWNGWPPPWIFRSDFRHPRFAAPHPRPRGRSRRFMVSPYGRIIKELDGFQSDDEFTPDEWSDDDDDGRWPRRRRLSFNRLRPRWLRHDVDNEFDDPGPWARRQMQGRGRGRRRVYWRGRSRSESSESRVRDFHNRRE